MRKLFSLFCGASRHAFREPAGTRKVLTALALAAAMVSPVAAQQAPAAKGAPKAAPVSTPKAGAGEKVCRHKFPDGTPKAWVCKKEEPCCAWDEIKYVKCGSTTFACL